MTVLRWRIGGISKTLLVLFLVSTVVLAVVDGSFASSFEEQLAKMRVLRDLVKAHPEQLSTEQKQELVRTLDANLKEIGSAIRATTDPNIRKCLVIMTDLVEHLQLNDAKTMTLLKKLKILDDWVRQTAALAQLLQPNLETERRIGQERRSGALIVKFSGSDRSTTRPFRVEDGWEIQWDYKPSELFSGGGIFVIYLHEKGGDFADIVASQIQPGSGSAYRPKGGRYYLEVNALGSWKIRVVQVQE